jgi:UDP-3-O-[3-hydroxymyristoyl] glucosamine N-acyltransferase
MADPRFFTNAGPFSVAEIAQRIGAEIAGVGAGDLMLRDVAPLDGASGDTLSFLDNKLYLQQFQATKAGAVIVTPEFVGMAPPTATLLVTPHPYRGYALAAQTFYPVPAPVPGIAPSAVIDPTATLGEGCRVEPNAVIGPGVTIGRRCQIGANAVISASVTLGDDVRVGPNATLSHCIVGSRVLFYPGVRIGQDGFGFAPDPTLPVKVPQLGRVIIGDDIEIGANTTIDRGAGPDTIIGSGTMIDNLVQIGHNVQIGRCSVIVAQVGISGSTRLGNYVMMGGQSGVAGHLTIGDGARIGAQAGLMRDVPPGESVLGSPALPVKEFLRLMTFIRRLSAESKSK